MNVLDVVSFIKLNRLILNTINAKRKQGTEN